MVLEMKIPSPGESITEVEISQWMVRDGDIVSKDQTIAEIDSDKATLDLPAEASGKITLKAEEGDLMAVGDIVCLIDTSAASDSKPSIKDPEIDIIVATVPRLMQLVRQRNPIDLSGLKFLVLDEADELMKENKQAGDIVVSKFL